MFEESERKLGWRGGARRQLPHRPIRCGSGMPTLPTHPQSAGPVTWVRGYILFLLQDTFTSRPGVLAQLDSVTWPG